MMHMKFKTVNTSEPRWVQALAAFGALRKQYEASNYYADDEVCWKAANEALLGSLQLARLCAWPILG
jgi:hypothetical protein